MIENSIYGFLRDVVPPHALYACAFVVVVFAIVLPLVLAQTPSFSEAAQLCSNRRTQIDPATKLKAKDVYFIHISNCLPMLSSLWIFWSVSTHVTR
jgi:hypothetical protein